MAESLINMEESILAISRVGGRKAARQGRNCACIKCRPQKCVFLSLKPVSADPETSRHEIPKKACTLYQKGSPQPFSLSQLRLNVISTSI